MVIPEPRGVGASFGVNDGFWRRVDAKDMKCVIDSVGKKDWCNGNVGMFGGSNCGMIQLLTASEAPEHLKAIIPNDNNPDFYYQNYPNGASALPHMPGNHSIASLEADPVDDDPAPDYPMAVQALKNHEKNGGFLSQYSPNMRRDSENCNLGYAPNMEVPAWEHMDNIKYSDVQVYANASWYDSSCTGAILGYKYYGSKMLIGPWTHCQIYFDSTEEPEGLYDWQSDHISFFDETLKGAGSSRLNEPPILYYTINADEGKRWRYAADWPMDSQTHTDMYFSGGKLCFDVPQNSKIEYNVNLDTGFYKKGGKLHRNIDDDLSTLDEKCITFTSDKLTKDVELTGIPSMSIWVTSTHSDGNFIALLEEVSEDGASKYITDGAIRASHGKITPHKAWESMGLPYHSSKKEDMVRLDADKPLNLCFNMEAVSRIVKKGRRLRVSIMCAEKNMYQQPEGFPEKPPTITLHTGEDTPSFVRLPVIRADVAEFIGDNFTVHAFKRGIYVHKDGVWKFYKNKQVYNKDGSTLFVTDKFTAYKTKDENTVTLKIDSEELVFCGRGEIPNIGTLNETSTEIKKYRAQTFNEGVVPDFKSVYVATVPIKEGRRDFHNTQPYTTLDLFMDIALPDKEGDKFPCIVNIHGYGGSHHDFYNVSGMLLEKGYAVASIDYRVYPPNIWPEPMHDAKAAIRFLKANAKKYRLDPERFGIIGASAGGHLSSMIAACNGDPETEGDIAGNNEYTSKIKAAAIYFPWTDIFTFGEQQSEKYPGQPDKVMLSDGPYAPLGCIVDYCGPGKGMGELKKHRTDSDPYYKKLIETAVDASPVSHVSENSAPSVFVHGIYECGIQIPMQQSVAMFEKLTQKGVKSLLLCNNNGIYGDDPEVMLAVVEFLTKRV